MEILASGKTGADKFDLRTTAPTKIWDRLSARLFAQSMRKFFEVVRGWSYSGDEGATAAINEDLSIITASNIADYESTFTQGLNTLIGFSNTLAVDGTSTANAIVLVPKKISSDVAPDSVNYSTNNPLPLKYQDDLEFTFTATEPNTGATTISIPSLSGLSGSIDLVDESGNALVGGELFNGKVVKIKTRTISSVKKAILIKSPILTSTTTRQGVSYLPKQITIANGTDTDHDLNFTAFVMNFDDGSGQALVSALTKQIDASWAAGTNQGGLDTGTVASNTPYYIYAIYNPTSGVSDILFTATKGSPTMPSGYTKKEYKGACYTNGSANIRNGKWVYGNEIYEFYLNTEITERSVSTTTSSITVTSPPGTFARCRVSTVLSVGGSNNNSESWAVDQFSNYAGAGQVANIGTARGSSTYLFNNGGITLFVGGQTGCVANLYSNGWKESVN
jgi:hypothetical protein